MSTRSKKMPIVSGRKYQLCRMRAKQSSATAPINTPSHLSAVLIRGREAALLRPGSRAIEDELRKGLVVATEVMAARELDDACVLSAHLRADRIRVVVAVDAHSVRGGKLVHLRRDGQSAVLGTDPVRHMELECGRVAEPDQSGELDQGPRRRRQAIHSKWQHIRALGISDQDGVFLLPVKGIVAHDPIDILGET